MCLPVFIRCHVIILFESADEVFWVFISHAGAQCGNAVVCSDQPFGDILEFQLVLQLGKSISCDRFDVSGTVSNGEIEFPRNILQSDIREVIDQIEDYLKSIFRLGTCGRFNRMIGMDEFDKEDIQQIIQLKR